MLKEHKAIVAKLKKLVSTAKKEKRPEFAHFAEKIMIHAQTESESHSLSSYQKKRLFKATAKHV